MNQVLAFEWPFSESAVERLGWVLVHSFWQFALVAWLAGVAVHTLRRNAATTRYALLVVAMAVSTAAPVATWMLVPIDPPTEFLVSRAGAVIELESDDLTKPRTAVDPFAVGLILASDFNREFPVPGYEVGMMNSQVPPETPTPSTENRQPVSSWLERTQTILRPWLAWTVTVWGLGVVLCSTRPLLGWHTLRRLQRVGVSPASDEVLSTLRRVSARLGLRRAVRVLQSTLAQVPVVRGDIDNDGDVDLVVTHMDDVPALLKNDSDRKFGSVSIRCVGVDTSRQALGATVRVTDSSGSETVVQIASGGSFQASHDSRLVVALPESCAVQQVSIRWPTGRTEQWSSLPSERKLVLIEGTGTEVESRDSSR
ncbi:MAG: ASPIC/UnbV domain-containing protein [Planctomycetota bacterium]|nr:ASPIC/UnbV domain-containing protein [Planctomycetota bacterium]MDA1164198.1 ASPIC/UnbV domain-containing protein [Planctomycetota bacterium]